MNNNKDLVNKNLNESKNTDLRQKVWEKVCENPGLCPAEYHSIFFSQHPLNVITARISELVSSNDLCYIGTKKSDLTGHRANRVYVATEENKAYHKKNLDKMLKGQVEDLEFGLILKEFLEAKNIMPLTKIDFLNRMNQMLSENKNIKVSYFIDEMQQIIRLNETIFRNTDFYKA